MTKQKASAKVETPRQHMGEHMRAISTTVRQNLAGSLCPNDQAEYERRLAEDAKAPSTPE